MAASALAAFTKKLNQMEQRLRKSITCDQGREMTCHKALTKATGMKVYFCAPHSPQQKGSCENMHGLLRQYLPKSEDLSGYGQQQLDVIADRLNNRPRQILHWRSPQQVFADFFARLRAVTKSWRITRLGVALHIGHHRHRHCACYCVISPW